MAQIGTIMARRLIRCLEIKVSSHRSYAKRHNVLASQREYFGALTEYARSGRGRRSRDLEKYVNDTLLPLGSLGGSRAFEEVSVDLAPMVCVSAEAGLSARAE